MRKKTGSRGRIVGKMFVNLIFLLAVFLVLFLGIHTAGKTISFAQAERIEIINNLVEGLSESSKIKHQGKKLQNVIYKYTEAFVKAVAGFEFVPRNDFTILPRIINALPPDTEILAFSYQGRNLTISTRQEDPENVVLMAENLKKKIGPQEEFEQVVYSYYIAQDGQCIAQITMIAHHYDETDLGEELEKHFLPQQTTEKEE